MGSTAARATRLRRLDYKQLIILVLGVYLLLLTFKHSTPIETARTASSSSSPVATNTQTVALCTEKCKYDEEICTKNLYTTATLPAPQCLSFSTSLSEDLIYNDKAYATTVQDHVWSLYDKHHRAECWKNERSLEFPAMYPDEFEVVTKTLINLKGKTYLEWGTGFSTTWYPLLFSGKVWAIDNYKPWCKKVQDFPSVKCLLGQDLFYYTCEPLKDQQGEPIAVGQWGIPEDKSEAAMKVAGRTYIDVIDHVMADFPNVKFDAALVDGRFRTACSLKLLNYLHEDSVLIIHDFFPRAKSSYHKVLDYFSIIGRSRSVVILKMKKQSEMPAGTNIATAYESALGDFN